MKKTINEYEFVKSFDDCGRGRDFSEEGRIALFKYITALEEELGKEFELDVISLCVRYSEYDSIDELVAEYGESVQDNATVIYVDNGHCIVECY